jgi:phosphoserine aminotransferase
MNYRIMAENDSMKNTPPCWPIYIAMLVLEWIQQAGGLEAMKAHNEKKARILYDYLDTTDFYRTNAFARDRSLMNVTFKTNSEELDAQFIAESKERGMSNLKGHRSVGGMRASIYNAMPLEGVSYLVDFMKEFEKKQG